MHFWEAEYDNGMKIGERTGSYHELDRSRVRVFRIVDEDGRQVAALRVKPETTFFYRRRAFQGTGSRFIDVRMLGYWAGSMVKALWVSPGGQGELRDGFIPGDAVYGEPEMFAEERADRVRKAALIG